MFEKITKKVTNQISNIVSETTQEKIVEKMFLVLPAISILTAMSVMLDTKKEQIKEPTIVVNNYYIQGVGYEQHK